MKLADFISWYAKKLTLIMFNLEGGPDDVISVGVHSEREGRAVALGPVVVVCGQNFHHLPWLRVLLQHRSVILEERGRVVVDVLHDDSQGGRGRLGRDAVVDRQDFHLQEKQTSAAPVRREEKVRGPKRAPREFGFTPARLYDSPGLLMKALVFAQSPLSSGVMEKSNRLASGNCLWKLLRRRVRLGFDVASACQP